MKLTEIKKIEEILLVDKPLLRHKILGLVSPMQNGASFLVNVELRLKNEKNFEEKFELVAKLVSPTLDWKKTEAFKNEIAFYTLIIPLIQQHLKLWDAKSLDFFPKYYGGRLTLNPKIKEADRDAVFFLENLKISGYRSLEPHIGFDLETTKLAVLELAKFHATFVAMKHKKPEIFKHKIKPYINTVEEANDIVSDTKQVISLMWENEACVSLIPRVRRAMSRRTSTAREPFATIIHGDFWTNNIMVQDGTSEKIKIFDFQKFTYGSPATDLVFFLFTSVDTAVLEQSFEGLTDYYYKNLISFLENLECDVASLSLGDFVKETNTEARTAQFARVMVKLNSVFGPQYAQEHKEKCWFIVQEFAKRNWI